MRCASSTVTYRPGRSRDLEFWRTLDWWFDRQEVRPEAAAIDVVDKPEE
jgi:hypothetical protein